MHDTVAVPSRSTFLMRPTYRFWKGLRSSGMALVGEGELNGLKYVPVHHRFPKLACIGEILIESDPDSYDFSGITS